MKNRTTNERFSRKKPPAEVKRVITNRTISMDSDMERADSTGSSLLQEIEKLKQAEDIIKEFADPEDFTGKKCVTLWNNYAMCCNRTMPSQSKIYYELIKGKTE